MTDNLDIARELIAKEIDPGAWWFDKPDAKKKALLDASAALSALLSAPAEVRLAVAEALAPGRIWPRELTPALRDALGIMNFQTGPIAHIYRAAGFDIRRKCEDEQAFVLHRIAGYALEHGDKWREAAQADLNAIKDKLAAASAGKE